MQKLMTELQQLYLLTQTGEQTFEPFYEYKRSNGSKYLMPPLSHNIPNI